MKSLVKKLLQFFPPSFHHFARTVYTRSRTFFSTLVVRVKILLSLPLRKRLPKIHFEVHLAEHCNLNCYACNNFSPIAEPEFVDIEEFRRDFERMGSIFSHSCERIYLLGGEPLLHPEIITLMEIARKNFREGDISVFTNGLLLKKMDDSFWKACRDNNVGIILSAYPIKLDIEGIKALAEKFGVRFQYAWGDTSSMHDMFSITPLNLKGDSNAKLNFGICVRAQNCLTLSHGKLFTCSFVPHVHHFNKKFGENIEVTPEDYVNIYDDVKAEYILKRMSEPIPACRYCRLDNKSVRLVKWGISKGEKSEWV